MSRNSSARQDFRRAKGTLRWMNLINLLLCVVALVCLYMQSYWSVKVEYQVTETEVKSVLDGVFEQDLSVEDLKGANFSLSVDVSVEGKEIAGTVQNFVVNRSWSGGMEGVLSSFRVLAEKPVKNVLSDVISQGKGTVSRILSVYIKVIVADKQGEIAEGSTVTDAGVEEFLDIVKSLEEADNLTVSALTEQVEIFLQNRLAEYGLTDADVSAVTADMTNKLTQVADKNGKLGMAPLVARILKTLNFVGADTEVVSETAADDLTAALLENDSTGVAIFGAFLGLAALALLQALLWALLLLKTLLKVLTGHPMGAFFTKLLSALPYILLVLLPTLVFTVIGIENIPVLLGLLGQIGIQPAAGANIAFGGCYGAAICTLVLFIWGFFCAPARRRYKRAKRALRDEEE